MNVPKRHAMFVGLAALLILGACGNRAVTLTEAGASNGSTGSTQLGGRDAYERKSTTSIWELFRDDNADVTVRVNKYLWAASLEVLDFLPVQSVDPFSGVIVTGYGTPPGGGRSYRATIYIRDPALDARSLNVAMQTRGGGAVSEGTVRAVEDAILTRARQLRIADGKL